MSNGNHPPQRRHLEIVRNQSGLTDPTPPPLSLEQLEGLMGQNPLFSPNQREDYQVRSAVGTSIETAIERAHPGTHENPHGRTMVLFGLVRREVELQNHPNPAGFNFTMRAYGEAGRQRHQATLLLPYNRNQHAISHVVTEDYKPGSASQWHESSSKIHIATNGELMLAADLWRRQHWAFGPQEHLGALVSLGMPLRDSLKPDALKQVDPAQAADLFLSTLEVLKAQSHEVFTPDRPFQFPAEDPELVKATRGIRAFLDSGMLRLLLVNKAPRCWEVAELASDGRTPPKLHTYVLGTTPYLTLPNWEDRPTASKARTVTQEQLFAAEEIVQRVGGLPLRHVTADQRRIASEQWGFTPPQEFSYFQRKPGTE